METIWNIYMAMNDYFTDYIIIIWMSLFKKFQ